MDKCQEHVCPHCAKHFKKEKYLNVHLKNIHPQDKNIQKTLFACDYCLSFFKNPWRLKVHKARCHSSANQTRQREHRNFVCDYCGKKFIRKHHLLQHIQSIHMCSIEQQKTMVSCKLCNSHFKNKLWLGRHIAERHIKRNESHENNYVACEDVFNDVFKHLKDLDMQNDILSQALEATDVSLIPEIDIEKVKLSSLNGKIFYHCDFCTKRFPKLSLLQRHLTVHGTQKPYKCFLCSMKFRYSSSLRFHAKEHHNFKDKSNRNDVFIEQFQKYVNKMKSNPMLYKDKKVKPKRKKPNDANRSNENVQNENLSMPILNSSIESEFLTKDCPSIPSNLEVQTRLSGAKSPLQNIDFSDVMIKKISDKVKDCLIKRDSPQSMNTFNNNKDKEKVNIIDETCATDENSLHTCISDPIDGILDNETSLDISLSDLPGNCSFENISLSEIDVERIDTNDSTIEQNSKGQIIIDTPSAVEKCEKSNIIQSTDTIKGFSVENEILECRLGNNFQIDKLVNKNMTDSILDVKHSMVNDTSKNKFVDISYKEQSSKDTSVNSDYVLDGAHLTNFPSQIYIINDELYIGRLVTIQSIDDIKDDQSIIPKNKELQEPVQKNNNNCTFPLNKIETFAEDKTLNIDNTDTDDIQDILDSLNIKVISNTNENESIQKTSETMSDQILVDHTYIKMLNLQNINKQQSELVNPNMFLNDSQGINQHLRVSEEINENNVNTSFYVRQDINDTLLNNQRASIYEFGSFHQLQNSMIGLDVAQNQKDLSHSSQNIQSFQISQNESAFRTKTLPNNNSTTNTFIDGRVLQIYDDACTSECSNKKNLLDSEMVQNDEAISEIQCSLNEQTSICQSPIISINEVNLPTNNHIPISDNEVDTFLLDFDGALDSGRMSKPQCSVESQPYINNDPTTCDSDFILQIEKAAYSPTNKNQTALNDFNITKNDQVVLNSQGPLNFQTLTYQNVCDDQIISTINNDARISGTGMKSSSVNFDREDNIETLKLIQTKLTQSNKQLKSQHLLKEPINKIVSINNDKGMTETNNNKCISNVENHDFLVFSDTTISKEASSTSLCLLEDYNLISQNVSLRNDKTDVSFCDDNIQTNLFNSDTFQANESVFESQVNEDVFINNNCRTVEKNVNASAFSTATQIPLVDFDVAQTSEEILQSLLSDESLPSVSLSSISKKEQISDTIGDADEEKILLKLLSKRNLKYMMQSDEGHFSCDLCLAKFARKTHLKDHKKIHERNSLWICDTCNKVFASEKSITLHFKYHNQKQTQCKVCGVFRHPLSMRSHMRKHNNDTPYSCPICKKTFRNTSTRNYHMKVKHVKDLKGSRESLVNLISDVVDTEVAAEKTEINIPFISPSANEIGNVKKRNAKSASKSKLVKTRNQKDNSNVNTCFDCECGMLFRHKSSLDLHKHKYNNQPHVCHFSCNICNKVFTSKSWLTRHLRTARHKYNENKTK